MQQTYGFLGLSLKNELLIDITILGIFIENFERFERVSDKRTSGLTQLCLNNEKENLKLQKAKIRNSLTIL